MTTRVTYPIFELSGPACLDPTCKGVMVDHLSMRSGDFYRQCSVCRAESGRMPAQEKLKEATATIERVLGGKLKRRGRNPIICSRHVDGAQGFRTKYGYRMHMRAMHGGKS